MTSASNLDLGFGFIEIFSAWLIALFISIAMLMMQMEILQTEKHTYYSTIANIQIENLIERFRANTSAVNREKEFHIWNEKNSYVLPKSHGQYDCFQDLCKISIFWNEREEQHITMEIVV